MAIKSLKSFFQLFFPFILLTLFALIITFPDTVFFFNITPKSWKGIGSKTYTVSFIDDKDDKTDIRFSLKRVPAGIAPGYCTDEPGKTRVDHPFMLSETEVTGALWTAVRESPSAGFYTLSIVPRATGDDHPLEYVSWRDSIVFCNALSAVLGFTPVYYLDELELSPINSAAEMASLNDTVFEDPSANGFRLPHSAEWELAARYIDGDSWTPGGFPSGGSHQYYFETRASLFAVYSAESSMPVKSRASNRLGLYDMSGNVWEWCFDRFDRQLVENSTDKRVVRGGGWLGTSFRLQIGGEFGSVPSLSAAGQGFRIAKSGW